MRFTPLTPFKLWLGDRLIGNYLPGGSFTVRDGNDWLRAVVLGGPLPGNEPTTIETPDLSQTETKPGEESPGLAKQGLVVITSLEASGGVAGSAEVKKEG